MADFIDQMNRKVMLAKTPRRIVSLVPSQTELLFDLGLKDEVAGITKFCIHPREWFHTKSKVGGTKQLHLNAIRQLQPDLILANREENVKEQVELLAQEYPVWISDIATLQDAFRMMLEVGKIVNRHAEAEKLVAQIKTGFQQLPATYNKIRTACFIWRKPYMTAGGDTFIHQMMELAGFENIFASHARYPAVTLSDLKRYNCQLLLLSSEPFPFSQKHIAEIQPELPGTRIELVDGEMFSWYGSRMKHAAAYFSELREKLI